MEIDTQNHKLVKVMADSSNKRVLLSVFCFGLALLITVFLISAFAIPHTFFIISGLETCPNDFSTFKGFCHSFSLDEQNVWESYLSGFEKKNSFFVISGRVERDQASSDVEMQLELDFKAIIIPVDDNGDPIDEAKDFEHTRMHKFSIHCAANSVYCKEHGFILYPQTNHQNYKIRIEIELDKKYNSIIKGIRFFAKTQNPAYTSFLIAVRYTCLAISILFFIFYFLFYRTIKQEYKTFEHKYIFVLSIALIFFADPLYAATVLKSTIFLTILSSLFVVSFITLLLFYWAAMVQRIHKESIRVSTQMVNKKNIALGVAIFVMLSIIVCYSSIFYRFDPAVHVEDEYPIAYMVFLILVILTFIVLLLLFFYNAYRIFKIWNKVIPRHQFFFTFSFYFVILLFFLIITGLHQVFDFNGVRVLMLFVLLTYYVIVLQLMWRFDNKSKNHFIDAKNYEKASDKNSADSEKKDVGMNYFDQDCEIEITKTGGFRRRENSVATLEQDNEYKRSRSAEFETAHFDGIKEKSNLDDKLSFQKFQTKNENKYDNDEEHSSFEIEIKNKQENENKLDDKNKNADFFNENEVEQEDEEDNEPVNFAYQEFRDLDEEDDDTQYEFDTLEKNKSNPK